jgi:hypothetical protein
MTDERILKRIIQQKREDRDTEENLENDGMYGI